MKIKSSLKFAQVSILAAMTTALSIASNITPSQAAPPVKPNMTLTFINRGAYIAKYNIQYNINGKNQTFESGKITVGKRFTFVVPGNVEAISTEGIFFNGIFLQQVGSIFFNPRFENRHSNVCVTTYGTTFKPSHDSSCK